MIWVTSDHHLGHINIIKYTERPFEALKEMDDELVRRWNGRVKPKDSVYHLGDFTLGGVNVARSYFSRLNGKIYVVPGGHDRRWVKTKEYLYSKDYIVTVLPQLYELKYQKRRFVLCHYPMRSWEGSHYGSIHLHGHCHGTIGLLDESSDTQLPPDQKRGKRLDVSVDCWDFYPITIHQVMDVMGKSYPHDG